MNRSAAHQLEKCSLLRSQALILYLQHQHRLEASPAQNSLGESFPLTPGNFGAEPMGLNDSFVNPTDPIRRVIRRGLMLFALAEDTSQLPVLISGTAREPCHGGKRREVECVPGPSWSELPYPTGSYKTALVRLAFLLV